VGEPNSRYWSVDECRWLDCPSAAQAEALTDQRTSSTEPAVPPGKPVADEAG
jgi:hypothetical protein